MKLQRIYHKIEDLSLSLKWLRGDEYESLYKHEWLGPTKDPTIEQVSFGYSYVADMKMRPYEGRRRDCHAAIDIYVNNTYFVGIPILQMAYLKMMLTSETDPNICYFRGGYKEGEKCNNTGKFRVSVNYENKKWSIYYSDICFEFRGQQIEDDRILALNKGDVTGLIKAFNKCEKELRKVIPLLLDQELEANV